MSRSFPLRRLAWPQRLRAPRCSVASDAAADWPTNPAVNLPICTAANQQLVPAIAPDMAGGGIICWYDFRDGVDFDIYAQHVLATGVVDPRGPPTVAWCVTPRASRPLPKVVSDGAGGAMLAWQDPRSGSNDVYAHHLQSDGSLDPAWPVNGLAVSTSVGGQILLPRHRFGQRSCRWCRDRVA